MRIKQGRTESNFGNMDQGSPLQWIALVLSTIRLVLEILR